MSQLWAITKENGEINYLYTAGPGQHPSECGNEEACAEGLVWPLDREPEPRWGETVEHESGEIIYRAETILPTILKEIKQEAFLRIEAVAPLWKQINDLHDPDSPGKEERSQSIQAVRDWSNQLEAEVVEASTVEELKYAYAKIRE